MNGQDVRNLLRERVLLFDGATGTYARSMPDWPEGPVERACTTAPDKVFELHRAYLDAGCNAIKTNTFAAHIGLAAEDEAHQKELILGGVSAAFRAAGRQAYVFADIGPAPAGSDMRQAYIRMADSFLACGVSCFLFETMQTSEGIAEAAAYIKEKNPEAYVAVSFAADPDGVTRAGELADSLIEVMSACEAVDAVGLNCVCGAYHLRRLFKAMPDTGKKLLAMPNAGYPHVIDGRTYYDSDPAYYASQSLACVSQGARMIGGCCGTTPEHMRAIAQQLDAQLTQPQQMRSESVRTEEETGCRSRIARKLTQGGRPILVELDPPRNSGISDFLSGARALSLAGADAVTIADCPIGRARMDSCLLACKLARELGIEALPHMTCRDRNVNATKALLLGLSMEGVHNVLAVTGDPVPASDRDSIKSVFQFNSRVLARFVRSLSQAGETEPFFLCGALNVNAPNFDSEIARAEAKEECGMEAFLTQPVLSERAAENIMRARRVLRGKIFGGIFPVVSSNNARFLQSEVAGISLDDRVVSAYEGLDRAQGEDLAVRLSRDAAMRIAPYVDGYYIMTPFQRVSLVCRVIDELKKL